MTLEAVRQVRDCGTDADFGIFAVGLRGIMTEPNKSEGNATSQAVRAVAEVAKLLIQPFSTYAQAQAESFRLQKLAKTEVEVEELRGRARMSLEMESVRHQINKERILRKAGELLESHDARGQLPSTLATNRVEEDWLFKWAGLAQDVSSEEVQWLWAKVLAGELTRPGRFSLRLLSTLSSLRQSDAVVFERFCNYVWEGPGKTWFQLYTSGTDELLQKRQGMAYDFYSSLQGMGLLDANSRLVIRLRPTSPLNTLYGGDSYSFTTQSAAAPPLRVRLLTGIGAELFGLCAPKPDADYVKLLSSWAVDNGIPVAWAAADSFSTDFVRSQPRLDFDLFEGPDTFPVWR